MKVTVRLVAGGVMTVEVSPEETVGQLLQRIRELEGRETAYALENLVYAGKILIEHHRTLAEVGIPDEALLNQVKRALR